MARSAILLAILLLVGPGCEGPTGPAGADGAAGNVRTVYEGVITDQAIPPGGQRISVPEIHLDDFPLVAVYFEDEVGDFFPVNLTFFDPGSGVNLAEGIAWVEEGAVFFLTSFPDYIGNQYRVVIIQ